jgi:hypothetical protein
MSVPVSNIIEGKVYASKTDVRLRVQPHSQRVPVCHEDPLSDIELTTLCQHRGLDVFLHYVLRFNLLTNVEDFDQIFEQANSAAARRVGRFHDPDVALAINSELRELLLEQFIDI